MKKLEMLLGGVAVVLLGIVACVILFKDKIIAFLEGQLKKAAKSAGEEITGSLIDTTGKATQQALSDASQGAPDLAGPDPVTDLGHGCGPGLTWDASQGKCVSLFESKDNPAQEVGSHVPDAEVAGRTALGCKPEYTKDINDSLEYRYCREAYKQANGRLPLSLGEMCSWWVFNMGYCVKVKDVTFSFTNPPTPATMVVPVKMDMQLNLVTGPDGSLVQAGYTGRGR